MPEPSLISGITSNRRPKRGEPRLGHKRGYRLNGHVEGMFEGSRGSSSKTNSETSALMKEYPLEDPVWTSILELQASHGS